MVQLVKALVDCPLGPGFESQVPQKLCVILFQVFQYALKRVGPSCSLRSQAPDGLQAKSDGHKMTSTIHTSQCVTWKQEKSYRLERKWVKHLLLNTLIQAQHPPFFVISFSLHYIYLFC